MENMWPLGILKGHDLGELSFWRFDSSHSRAVFSPSSTNFWSNKACCLAISSMSGRLFHDKAEIEAAPGMMPLAMAMICL